MFALWKAAGVASTVVRGGSTVNQSGPSPWTGLISGRSRGTAGKGPGGGSCPRLRDGRVGTGTADGRLQTGRVETGPKAVLGPNSGKGQSLRSQSALTLGKRRGHGHPSGSSGDSFRSTGIAHPLRSRDLSSSGFHHLLGTHLREVSYSLST